MADLIIGIDGRRARAGGNVVLRTLQDIRSGVHAADRSVHKFNQRMRAATDISALFRRAIGGFGAAVAAREFIQLSDSFTNIQNRLKIVTDNAAELSAVQDELLRISQETRTSFEANATLYNRLALSSKDLGLSLQEVLDVTQSLNQAVILSGAATTEAAAGLIQLSQGLASNRLSGDELRSVLEQLPVVADVIAKELGVTRGELKFFGEQGKLTTDVVIRAFKNAREELATKFAKTVPTVAQSFTILRNAAIRFIGNLNNSTGIVTNLSRFIIQLAFNFETLAKSIAVVAAAFGPTLLVRSLTLAKFAFLGLFTIIRNNPLGALITLLSGATAALVAFGNTPIGDTLEDASDGFAAAAYEAIGLADAVRNEVLPAQTTLSDLTKGVFQTIVDYVTMAANWLREKMLFAINKVTEYLGIGTLSWRDLFEFIRTGVSRTVSFFVGLGKAAMVFWQEVGNLVARGFQAIWDVVKQPIMGAVELASKALGWLATKAKQLFGIVVESAQEALTNIGATGDFRDLPIIAEGFMIGDKMGQAFMEGFNQDYLPAIGGVLEPVIGRVIENTGDIVSQRLADQAARLEAQRGVNLSEKPEGRPPVPINVQRFFAKAIKDTLTPLEKQQAIMAQIEEARPWARTAQELTALDRMLEQSKLTRLDEELDLIGLDSLADIMSDATPPLERYTMAVDRLQELLAEGAINQQQFDAAIQNAKDNILGLKDITAEFAKEAAKNIQSAFADFLFDPFSEGLDGMVRQLGETLRKITSEILSTMILRQLFSGLSTMGGGVGNFFATAAGALAEGGPARAGQTYLVGENGPELFTPRQSGMVVPNEMMGGAMAAPTVNVAPAPVIVVDDPKKVERALQSAGGQRALVDAIAQKKGAINQALR